MGITFAKGEQISFTGSKVKGEESESNSCSGNCEGERHVDVPRRERQSGSDPRTGK